MWRAIARSATYDSHCWSGTFRSLLTPVSTSTLLTVLVSALLFLGVVPAPILLWFSLGLVCAAVCLRVTRPDQFHDASQASGSFALSLLTGAPRSETASLLLLPPSHSGLMHLAMLDRDWLSAGGNLLFGSPGKSNRLTDKDLAMLMTHVHDVNCKHCNLSSSSSSSSAYSIPTFVQQKAAALPTAGMSSTGCSTAAAATAGGGGSHLPLPYASSTQRQFWSAVDLQQQGGWGQSSSSSGSSGGAVAAAGAAAWRAPAPPAVLSSAGASLPQQQQQLQPSQHHKAPVSIGAMSDGHTQHLPLPPWGAQGAVAASALNSQAQSTLLPSGSSASSSTAWQAGMSTSWPAGGSDAAAVRSSGLSPAAPVTPAGPGVRSATATATAPAAPPAAGLGQHWPNTEISSAALAALSAHQSSVTQSSFHQSLLKAWDSYTSLDSLDDANISVCSICLGSYKPGVLVTGLPCGHMYHKDCVLPWLLQQGRQSTCPMCKADVFL